MPVARPPDARNSLARLATLWRAHENRARRRALGGLLVAALLCLAHLARLGTPLARLTVAGLLLAALAIVVWLSWRAREAYRSHEGIVNRAVSPAYPELGARTLRALRLVEKSELTPVETSPELARLHLDRLVARIDEDHVERRAAQAGRRWHHLGLLAGALALTAVFRGPFRVVEGLDILFARHGEAPLAFDWLDEILVVATPPAYLHENARIRPGFGEMSLPRGTTLIVRGRPVHAGRQLVLVDDLGEEIPFVDDAQGGMVARFTLGESTRLGISARFGGVRIPQRGSFELVSIPDLTPEVVLEGAPRTARLLDEPEIVVSYEVRDDHGLREIHLVLRAGNREDRRVLAELDGEPRAHRGAMRLKSTDPFFRRTYVPVELVVEARDNDPITGPKWGKSEAITLLPPAVGEPEALRYAALGRARDGLVDLLAFRGEAEVGAKAAELREHAQAESIESGRAFELIEEILDASYGGLSVPRRTSLLIRGQLRRLREALAAELRSTTQKAHDEHLRATEDATLSMEAIVRALGARDSASISKRLADVAEDAASGAEMARSSIERARGITRLEAAEIVLEKGGEQLLKLGALGQDLGEIVDNGLRRIRRAKSQENFFHAELAARDLAARLKNPLPSFSGGGGGGGTGEGGGGEGGDPGDFSEAEGEITRQARELEDLARDHAAEIAEVEQALRDGMDQEELAELSEEARRRAQEIRETARSLGPMRGEPGTAESSAASGREHAEAMAGALERNALADAVESGQEAMRALEEAERNPSRFSPFDDARVQQEAREARDELAPHLAWAEKALEELRQKAGDHARDRLRDSARREAQLAERARELLEEGKHGLPGLPEELLDLLDDAESLMREAQRALGAAQGEQALERQRSAQRLLERARDEGDEGEGEGDEGASEHARRDRGQDRNGEDPSLASKLPIPSAREHQGPEAFRKRVLEGLGGSNDPRLREAIKRYAEGLLR